MSRSIATMLGATLAAVLLATAAPADAALSNARESAVTFSATGPAGLNIEGKTNELRVTEADGKVRFVVPLANLDTGIGLRNKHMREKYLDVAKFPTAELVIDRKELKFPEDGKDAAADAGGTMTIHGVSKRVTVKYKVRRSHSTYAVEATVPLNMKEFGIDVPSYMGVTVKPEVTVGVRTKLDD